MLRFVKRLLSRKRTTAYFWQLRNRAIVARFAPLRLFYRHAYRRHLHRFGCDIPLNTAFNGCPTFPHGLYGIFISQGAHIGRDVVIYQHVTIGSNTLSDSKGAGAPTIGDGVLIGAGVKIIGGVTIGDNARIGANAVVVKDVPANATVVLPAPRVIEHEHRTVEYKTYNDFAGV